MDTQTVLEIIKIIEHKHDSMLTKGIYSFNERHFASDVLWDLRNHLQEYIEGQLNAAENQTVE